MIIAAQEKGYFPTPKSLLEQIENDYSEIFKELQRGANILEPSAGKGDIVDFIKERRVEVREYLGGKKYSCAEIDCIEINPELRAVLKGKNYRVVHDNFFSFESRKKYDLIFLNPPFHEGDKHLLKAIDLQEVYGGKIICILNAETIRNPYSNSRKELLNKLNKYNAKINYYTESFSSEDSERKTDVEVAVIGITINPPESLFSSLLFEKLDKGEKKFHIVERDGEEETDLINSGLDFLDAYVKQFNKEVDAGISLLTEYQAFCSVNKLRFKLNENEDDYSSDIIRLMVGKYPLSDDSINYYIKQVRMKYWHSLFMNPNFRGKLTSNLYNELYDKINEMQDYDFTVHNALELLAEIRSKTITGIEQSIMTLFNTLSSTYSYIDNSSNNIHYYNGWKTNKAHKVNKKVIIPMYGVWDSWRWGGNKVEWTLRDYRATEMLGDLSKALDYLASGEYRKIDTSDNLRKSIGNSFSRGISKDIETKYFILTFYKKGTCHITFKDDELLEKLNLFAGKQNNWLPPYYGKKSYSDMNEEERELVKEFSGSKENYDKIFKNQSEYLVDTNNVLLLSETA